MSDLDAQTGKIPFQSYTIMHGIEKIEVLVPFKNVQAFEAQVKSTDLPTRQAVLECVQSHGGLLK